MGLESKRRVVEDRRQTGGSTVSVPKTCDTFLAILMSEGHPVDPLKEGTLLKLDKESLFTNLN